MKLLKGKESAIILDQNGEVNIYIPKNIKEDDKHLLDNCLIVGALSILLTNKNQILNDLVNGTIKDMLNQNQDKNKEEERN